MKEMFHRKFSWVYKLEFNIYRNIKSSLRLHVQLPQHKPSIGNHVLSSIYQTALKVLTVVGQFVLKEMV